MQGYTFLTVKKALGGTRKKGGEPLIRALNDLLSLRKLGNNGKKAQISYLRNPWGD
jgi:hypothetical protein